LFTVETTRENARHCGLAGAALAGKNVAVSDPVLGNRIFKSGLDVLLADQLVKCLRPVLASDDLIHFGVAAPAARFARPRVIRGTRV